MTFSDKVYELLISSSVTQGALSIIVVLGALIIQVVQGDVPPWLVQLALLVVAFFFGSKAGQAQGKLTSYKDMVFKPSSKKDGQDNG